MATGEIIAISFLSILYVIFGVVVVVAFIDFGLIKCNNVFEVTAYAIIWPLLVVCHGLRGLGRQIGQALNRSK